VDVIPIDAIETKMTWTESLTWFNVVHRLIIHQHQQYHYYYYYYYQYYHQLYC